MNERERELYTEALYTWGQDAQFNMVIEEAMELGLAVSRFIRGRGDLNNIVDEIADMQIMLDQTMNIFDIRLKGDGVFEKDVALRKEEKLKRLEERLAKLR